MYTYLRMYEDVLFSKVESFFWKVKLEEMIEERNITFVKTWILFQTDLNISPTCQA